jgi:hypothetical protein
VLELRLEGCVAGNSAGVHVLYVAGHAEAGAAPGVDTKKVPCRRSTMFHAEPTSPPFGVYAARDPMRLGAPRLETIGSTYSNFKFGLYLAQGKLSF